jgi:hypothetical protein
VHHREVIGHSQNYLLMSNVLILGRGFRPEVSALYTKSMRKVLTVILGIAWALWFGGMVVLLIFVIRLFNTSKEIGIEAAPVLFRTFAHYQIIVGIIACSCGTLLAMQTRRTAHAAMTLLMLGAFAAALLIRGWTFKMETLRAAKLSEGPEFKAMHARSSMAYSTSAGLLLVSGIGWMLTLPTRGTDPEIAKA